jgi:hypothetical protein
LCHLPLDGVEHRCYFLGVFCGLFFVGVVSGFFNAAYLLRYCSPVGGREVGARVLGVLCLGTGAQAFCLLLREWRGGDGFLLGEGLVVLGSLLISALILRAWRRS